MNTHGRHWLVEYHGCQAGFLNDRPRLEEVLSRAANAAGATVVKVVFHEYSPYGVSGVVVIEESHFSIHTWPEAGYATVDFYTCGSCTPERAHEVLVEQLQPERFELMVVERGLPGPRSMQVVRHQTENASRSTLPASA